MTKVTVTPSYLLSTKLQTELLAFASGSFRIDGHCIGWLTTAAIVGAHTQGRLIACYNNDDLVGYVIWSARPPVVRNYVVWVRRDARLLLHGRALVDYEAKEGARRGCTRIELWCAADLAANLFWRTLGFSQVCWRWGRGRHPRRHWLWRISINALSPPPPPDELWPSPSRDSPTASAPHLP